ncbi:MAG TPA: YjbH domain-containing protein, partial [Candidatus Udaeobacter sp.]|nr:YjbH domain-containing protein [Candidatus Udaeobacter sp.]
MSTQAFWRSFYTFLAVFALCGPSVPAAAQGTADSTRAESGPAEMERALIDQGLENVSADPDHGMVGYENRRYRQSAEALGIARRAAGRPILAFERRRGLAAAAIETDERVSPARFHVLYPSDAEFPAPPAGPLRSTTFTRADLDLGALVDYRVGQIFDPLQIRVDLEPRLILNPWPGASARAGILIPVQNNFPTSALEPDLDRVRPGRISLDQFVWLPRAALASFSGGYFGDNRWGFALGAARPLDQGSWLIDAEVERTGFLAFPEGGAVYSSLDETSGFAGVTYRPPFLDLALRARAAQFLYGDRGVDLEARRSFGDLDVAYFASRSSGINVYGVRLDIPIPPSRRQSGTRIRLQPVERFGLSFRDHSEPIALFVTGVASREDYLRQLSLPSLEANAGRYRRALGDEPAEARTEVPWVSMTGMTGFINTPWAGTINDRGFEAGYNYIPRRWAWDHRGTNDNEVFYSTLGFLPRIETSLRWTRIPGYHSFQEIIPDSKLVDMDRMASGRIELLHPGPGRPGLAAGIEDAEGTRRFHSTYAVAGLPLSFLHVQTRASLGYGFRIFDATRYVLDGTFGAVECALPRFARVQIEYDS